MSVTSITVVTGPPCAGKSTYVREHAFDGDVRVDYDQLATALGSSRPHAAPEAVREAAFAARQAVIDLALAGGMSSGGVWVIHSSPRPELVAAYEEAGAAFVELDPGMDVVLARARADGRPEGTEEVIRAWYADRESTKGAAMGTKGLVRKTYVAKLATVESVETGGSGRFTALVSAFGVLDSQGDIIDRGAFAKTVALVEAGKKLPVVWSHDYYNPASIIGEVTAMRETDVGLEVDAVLDVEESETAAHIHRQMVKGRLTEFSIGGEVTGWEMVTPEKAKASGAAPEPEFHITEMDLWEVGPCFKGANPATELLSVKSLMAAKAGAALTEQLVEQLRDLHEELGEVLAAVEQKPKDEEDDPEDPGDDSNETEPASKTLSAATRGRLALNCL